MSTGGKICSEKTKKTTGIYIIPEQDMRNEKKTKSKERFQVDTYLF